jgi:hypothetical protein
LPFFSQDKRWKESINPHYKELEMKYKMIPKWVFLLVFLLFSSISLSLRSAGAPQTVKNKSSDHALIIGISEYENKQWSHLDNALKDGLEVGNELASRGFDVTYKSNPTLIELEKALREFFYNEKIDDESNLFLWYSGHGHNNVWSEGFLVPADAPARKKTGISNALPVKRFEEYSKYTKAKHVYMVFDSCFSSTIFIESTGNHQEQKM